MIASGGGVRNKTLMERLQSYLPAGLRLTVSDEFGLPAQYKEAIKFATLALAAQHQIANNIPAAKRRLAICNPWQARRGAAAGPGRWAPQGGDDSFDRPITCVSAEALAGVAILWNIQRPAVLRLGGGAAA